MNKTILRLAIPNILSNLTVPLLGMVDTALMGRMESEIYIGAVALGSVVLGFIYWSLGFLRMGTTGLTAQAYGAGEEKQQIVLFGQAILVASACAVMVLILQIPIAELAFWLIPGEETVKVLAKEYFYIRILAAPATIGLYALHGWFLGMQNARYPMILVIFSNVINVALNVYFVFEMGMKADGVAWATVIAQYAGAILALILFWHTYRQLTKQLVWRDVIDLRALKHFFSVNADIFIRTLCLIFVFAFFTAQSSGIDPVILAANQILLQYFYTMSFAVDGFAFAAESLVGRYIGEKNETELNKAVRLLFLWGIGFGLLFSLVYGLFGRELLDIFTDQQAVVEAANEYLPWIIVFPLSGAVAFMWDGTYIGATAVRPMRNTLIFSTIIVFLPVYYFAFPFWGNHALWLAMTLFMVARSVSLTVLAKRFIRVNG
ncbi:MAG: MATE family efflux transporter [Bacteroidota bacterium]